MIGSLPLKTKTLPHYQNKQVSKEAKESSKLPIYYFCRREGNGGLRGYKDQNKSDRNRKPNDRRDRNDRPRDNNTGYGNSIYLLNSR